MKNILVREYLESLTESEELDYIFSILLEVMEFKVISTPKSTKGLAQYGKDIIAIGTDSDGKRKRFYFEIKGGRDKDITTTTLNKPDGIIESIREAKNRPYKDSSIPEFNSLPIKIVIVHNGTIHASAKETFDGFIENEFANKDNAITSIFFGLIKWETKRKSQFEFERWDIHQLTDLFTKHLFNEYLLVDEEALKHFKKVLVLINTPRNTYRDFFQLINFVFEKVGENANLSERKRLLFFETIKMISFIVYHYSKEANNLEAAKKCIPFSILKLWAWIVENKLEKNTKVINHFRKNFDVLFITLQDYFKKTLPIATLKHGLWSPDGGRYEQVGYPIRAMEYLSYLIFYFQCQRVFDLENTNLEKEQINNVIQIINNNDGTSRPFFDNHSIPICLTLNFLINNDRKEDAKSYLSNVIQSIQLSYSTHRRLPDSRNGIESVIQYVVTKKKNVYYEEKTSQLFGIVCEYLCFLDMEEGYIQFKEFLEEIKVDLATFVPYNDSQLIEFLPKKSKSHETHLLTHELYSEGYQTEIRLEESFETFKSKILAKESFAYSYVTSEAGFPYLLTLAHIYYKTPLFPAYWHQPII
jgi:hypothetical protein